MSEALRYTPKDATLTDAQVAAAVEAASDSNTFTDADHSKLNAIEASATADQTDAEIRTAVEAATDSNVFTDADHTKLNAIEALADVTDLTNVTAAHSCTAATRPGSPIDGDLIWETDTDRLRVWTSGNEWLELSGPVYAWTPTWASGLTVGDGTNSGKYHLRGYILHWAIDFTMGSTSAMGTNPKLQPPSGMTLDGASGGFDMCNGGAIALDSGSSVFHAGTPWSGDSGDNVLTTRIIFGSSTITSTAPFTWATGDQLIISGTAILSDAGSPTS